MSLSPHHRPLVLSLAVAAGVIGWAYWPTFVEITSRWVDDPQYSHGFLVPVFSAYLLWRGRGRLAGVALTPRWWGVGLVAAGTGLRLVSHMTYQSWLDPVSLLIVLAGVAAAVGGWRALVWAGPAILFLGFMLPPPYRFQVLLGGTLQRAATLASTYVLQTVGVAAVAEGNVIYVPDAPPLGVVEACSGLSMMVTFFALAVGTAILINRPWIDRAIIVASAAPIAVISNVVRITVTALLFQLGQGDLAKAVFHDLAGWLMMPVALALLWAEYAALKRTIIPTGGSPPGG